MSNILVGADHGEMSNILVGADHGEMSNILVGADHGEMSTEHINLNRELLNTYIAVSLPTYHHPAHVNYILLRLDGLHKYFVVPLCIWNVFMYFMWKSVTHAEA